MFSKGYYGWMIVLGFGFLCFGKDALNGSQCPSNCMDECLTKNLNIYVGYYRFSGNNLRNINKYVYM